MNRAVALFASCAALLATGAVAESRHDTVSPSTPISFTLALSAGSARLELKLSTGGHSSVNNSFAPEALEGLDRSVLTTAGPVRFALAREPGRLACDGNAAQQIARGSCSFAPDADFSRYLAGRGIGMPSFQQSYVLAMTGANRAMIDALAQADYPKPTIDQLVALSALQVEPAYIAELARNGFRPDTLDDLTAFAALHIDGAYAGEMTRAVAGKLKASDLIALKAIGATPAYVGEMRQAGLGALSGDEIVQLKALDVSPAYIRDLAAVGYARLPADKLVAMKAVGVTAEDVRLARKVGIEAPTADQLIEFRALRHR